MMKAVRNLALLACLFVSGFVLGIGLKQTYEAVNLKAYEWKEPYGPIIANCYGEEFSELQMIRAVDYWVIRGFPIGFYEHSPPKSVCESESLHGFIILRKAKRNQIPGNTLATTQRGTIGLRIVWAEIVYQPGSQNLDLINEHELGHALGFGHLEEEGHIMHPRYDKMGRGFWVP